MSSLAERYRPKRWAEVVGQDKALDRIRCAARDGYGGQAWWLSGSPGTGKSSIGRLIAAEVADPLMTEELDGRTLTAERLRQIEHDMHFFGWGKGGRAWIFNEAHGIRADIIRQLLTLFEPRGGLPAHLVFVFTTTREGQAALFEDHEDAGPLLSRCTVIALARRDLAKPFAARAQEIAKAEGLDGAPPEGYRRLAKDCKNNMRAMLSAIQSGEMART
jgi:DNA polymerase-3 subunit gamma/tau